MARLTDCIAQMDQGIEWMAKIIPTLPEMEARLCRLTLMVGSRMEEGLADKLKPYQLNHSEFLALMILSSRPDGSSTPSELCELTAQGATNMTRIANTLVKRSLITRSSSKEDRRRIQIRITAAGKRFVQQMLPPMFPHIDGLFADFSDTDKRHLSRLLRKLAKNIDATKETSMP